MDAETIRTELLDPAETQFRIPGPIDGLRLFLRRLQPATERHDSGHRAPVLYVHGGTFPSALSIAHRFDGQSWRDVLCRAGQDVWGLDFHGFGTLSDHYPEMDEPPDRHPPLGRAEAASRQIAAAARFVANETGHERLSIIAHSWGTMPACLFAGRFPDSVDKLVLFGPVTKRTGVAPPPRLSAWRAVSLQQQWDRFVADTPPDHPPVLLRRHFDLWSETYLDCDPGSRLRAPPAVKLPAGPTQDIQDAWAGIFPYDPGLVRAPVCILRGEWDSLCTDADARWLRDALVGTPNKIDVKLPRGGHLMHLEEGRHALHSAAKDFLATV